MVGNVQYSELFESINAVISTFNESDFVGIPCISCIFYDVLSGNDFIFSFHVSIQSTDR